MAVSQIRVEVHPIAAQSCQPIAMPEKAREAIQLVRGIKPVKQSLVEVAGATLDYAITDARAHFVGWIWY